MASNYRGLGAVAFPILPASIQRSILRTVLDPARDILLGFFAQVIESEVGALWDAVKTGTAVASADVVEQAFHEPIEPWLALQAQFKWPLLSLYRTESQARQRTLRQRENIQQWILEYALPPVDLATWEKIGAVREGVAVAVPAALQARAHPDYSSGALVFGVGATSGITRAEVKEIRRGFWSSGPQGQGQTFPVVAFLLETAERYQATATTPVPCTGMDFTITEPTDVTGEELEVDGYAGDPPPAPPAPPAPEPDPEEPDP